MNFVKYLLVLVVPIVIAVIIALFINQDDGEQKICDSPLALYSLTSPDGFYSVPDLAGYARIKVVDAIKNVPGVADVVVDGPEYCARVWVDADALSKYSLSIDDVCKALPRPTNDAAVPAPELNESKNVIILRHEYLEQFVSCPEQLSDVVICRQGEEVVYLKNIAQIELGHIDYSSVSKPNDKGAVSIAVYRYADANVVRTRLLVEKCINSLSLPEGISIRESTNLQP